MADENIIQIQAEPTCTFTITNFDTQARIICTLIGDAAPLIPHLPALLKEAANEILDEQP